MKKILTLAFCTILLLSCGNKGKQTQTENAEQQTASSTQTDTHNAKNSLDYMGKYQGILPTASGEGMNVCITLQDSTYNKEVLYVGKSDKATATTGTYSWNDAGNTITLKGENKPNQYFVGENTLTQLDINGAKVEGDLASSYILKKQ